MRGSSDSRAAAADGVVVVAIEHAVAVAGGAEVELVALGVGALESVVPGAAIERVGAGVAVEQVVAVLAAAQDCARVARGLAPSL